MIFGALSLGGNVQRSRFVPYLFGGKTAAVGVDIGAEVITLKLDGLVDIGTVLQPSEETEGALKPRLMK
ncbi:hypothetical protein OCU04_004088 [Sclerotinia nivalis]|uniref:Uncharacterized protein n=1 Tax=Sclerotinia nivalis TaxID=352851 RepID=A0A9X0DPY8_9HELO|nr:hypothetical protein OCU04_004088 [Sclerotinia nivalis]